MITIDFILDTLEDWVQTKTPISAHTWLESAQKITVLLGHEHEELFKMAQIVARMRLEALKESKSATEAKMKIDATDEQLELKMKEAKIKRIEELVRIAKKQATLADTEMRLQ